MCGYKCVAKRSWLRVGIPRVFSMCMWVESFSATAWFLSHISELERQSYYTTKSCLHGTAAPMVRHDEPGYSLQRHVTKPGLWFMGQFRVGRESALIHLPLPQAFFDGIFKTSIFRTFKWIQKIQLFMRLKKVMKEIFLRMRTKVQLS